MTRRLCVLLAGLALAACAPFPRLPRAVAVAVAADLPLRLSPASLGRELALQQRLTVTAHGRTQQLEVALEANAEAVRLAVLAFGQTVARLEWDGRELRESRASGWPPAVTGSTVLRDLQLVHWPLQAIQPALPLGWSVQAEGSDRVLRLGERTMIRVRYPSPATAEFHNLAAGYFLRLETAQALP
jgi:hypothetical protein